MTERCELSDLPVEQCACRIHAPVSVSATQFVVTAWFSAHFNSRCDNCEKPVFQGDTIARTEDGYFICEGCGSR